MAAAGSRVSAVGGGLGSDVREVVSSGNMQAHKLAFLHFSH